jgi:hypothetical protein
MIRPGKFSCSMARDSRAVWLVAPSCWYHCLFTTYVLKQSANGLMADVHFKAVRCRLHQGECSACWRTSAWFSFVERVTGWPDFPLRWKSTQPEPRNFVTTDSKTALLGAVLLTSWNCSSTFSYSVTHHDHFRTSENNTQLWILLHPSRDPFPAIAAQRKFVFGTGNTCAGAMSYRQTYMSVRDPRVSVLYILSHAVQEWH